MKTEVTENIEYMAKTVWGEARGEDKEGRIAVASVILNRKNKQSWMGKTIKDVCLKKWQFSCWNENDPNLEKIKNLKLEDLTEFLDIAYGVVSGMYEDPTSGSTHYYAKSMKSPPKWAEGKEPVLDHGGHLFFNDVKQETLCVTELLRKTKERKMEKIKAIWNESSKRQKIMIVAVGAILALIILGNIF